MASAVLAIGSKSAPPVDKRAPSDCGRKPLALPTCPSEANNSPTEMSDLTALST